MKVLIVGQPKTGTTALLYALRDALGIADFVSEPPRLGFEDEYDDLIVKHFYRAGDAEHLGKYDKIVVVVRNGFDTLTSYLLFQPQSQLRKEPDRVLRRYVRMVRDAREGRAGITDLARCFHEMTGIDPVRAVAVRQKLLVALRAETAGRSVVLRYEDFMRGKLTALERYLGAQIRPAADVALPENVSYVSRSRNVENWPGWVSSEDMDELAPVFERFHRAFGYTFDRELLRTVAIEPREGEDYVWRTVRRWQRKAGPFWRVKRAYKLLRRASGHGGRSTASGTGAGS